jgi:erythronate-4-phosphate dehydrogenase
LRFKEKKMKIIADNKIPFLRGVLEPFCDIEYIQGDKISNSDLKDADALIIRT